MSLFSRGKKVIAPALTGGGTTEATFVRMERKVEGRRWVTRAVVRYPEGRAEHPLDPTLLTAKEKRGR